MSAHKNETSEESQKQDRVESDKVDSVNDG